MTQVTLSRPDLVDAFSRMPHGSAALDEACARHAAATPESLLGTPLELAARALALALIDAARGLDERGRAAA